WQRHRYRQLGGLTNHSVTTRGRRGGVGPASAFVDVYILALAGVAAVVCWWEWSGTGGDGPPDPVVVLALAAMGVAGVALRERDLGPHLGVSVAMVVLAAALPLAGPSGAVLVGATSFALDPRRTRVRTRAFNVAMTGAVGALGGLVYLVLGGVRVEGLLLEQG